MRRGALDVLFGILRLVCALARGALLTSCGGPGDGGGAAQPVGEASDKRPPGVARAAAAAVEEASIREDLARLTGDSPAPLPGGPPPSQSAAARAAGAPPPST